MVWIYQNADYSFEKKIIVSFIIIFGTLSFLFYCSFVVEQLIP